ncbi:hypothetical protein B0H11DRAFT_1749196, partial [Mycena galericulata]
QNYLMKFWIYHAMTWPQISFVAEDHKGRIVGYVLEKMSCLRFFLLRIYLTPEIYGHVNSISVLRSYRRLGLARKLMMLSRAPTASLSPFASEAMVTIYKASFVSLHVRKSNKPAIALYRDALGF